MNRCRLCLLFLLSFYLNASEITPNSFEDCIRNYESELYKFVILDKILGSEFSPNAIVIKVKEMHFSRLNIKSLEENELIDCLEEKREALGDEFEDFLATLSDERLINFSDISDKVEIDQNNLYIATYESFYKTYPQINDVSSRKVANLFINEFYQIMIERIVIEIS